MKILQGNCFENRGLIFIIIGEMTPALKKTFLSVLLMRWFL